MYCNKCGSPVQSNEKYCPVCGTAVTNDSSNEMSFDQFKDLKNTKPTYYDKTMLFGVLAIIFSVLNYVGIPFVHLVGIILGAVAVQYAKRDKEAFQSFNSTGRLLGIVGIVLGVTAMVIGAVFYNL